MKKILKPFKFIFTFVGIYSAFVIFNLLFFRIIDLPTSAFILSEADPIEGLFSITDVKHIPVSIQNMSKYAPLAAMASEDQVFFDHFGFDFEQIEKAMKENKHRKRIRGASTITMQVAKNMFLWNSKLIVRKGAEAYYTLLIELLWSKERILETYLNIAEMGKGIYGIEAAAKNYYGIKSLKLNASQAASIIACLPNPKKRNPKSPSGYLIGRKNNIMEQMNLMGGTPILNEKISY